MFSTSSPATAPPLPPSPAFPLPLVVGNESPQLAVLGTNGEGVVNNDLPDLTKGTDFGPVEWGASRTNTLAICNDGPASLSIAGWSTTGPGTDTFQVVGIPALIEAGGVSNFTVVFAPAVTGRFQVALGFDSDAVFPQTNILFAGTGVPARRTLIFRPCRTRSPPTRYCCRQPPLRTWTLNSRWPMALPF